MTLRVDTTQKKDTWQLSCPECGSRNWRANDGYFECRACTHSGRELYDEVDERLRSREEIEFVGSHANWKAPYAVEPGDDEEGETETDSKREVVR
ncbi:hypothetical protein AArcSl_1611 [Halalkaliarchaeum desulfuricum]|uniref:Uncharacterized protein n=1 Tax=Halalkaliarchaeum desulfuricum TaxID=2055893 RepID=A0A343TJG8_9EURY|nr:TFIIB-type zinc finger domain-containing protein [Halalkaliarchaeum desulfuricum]AUX09240.1 hypothetical protein AArcSl_1611 [Halalkaliarchaeum desulfuricum]